MSLLFHRREIQRAVAGQLSAADEADLRAHLRDCAACRRHYDALSLVAAGATAASRERIRLVAALRGGAEPAAAFVENPSPPAATPTRRRRLTLILAGVSLAAATAAMVVVMVGRLHTPSTPAAPEIAWRGGEEATAARNTEHRAPVLSLVLYASARLPDGKAGPVRLIGDLPGSGQAQVSVGDYLQFAYRGLEKSAHLLVLGVDGEGTVTEYVPGSGAANTAISPSKEVHPVGTSIDVGARHRPGAVRLYALFVDDAAAVNEARRNVLGPGISIDRMLTTVRGRVLRGVLNVVP